MGLVCGAEAQCSLGWGRPPEKGRWRSWGRYCGKGTRGSPGGGWWRKSRERESSEGRRVECLSHVEARRRGLVGLARANEKSTKPKNGQHGPQLTKKNPKQKKNKQKNKKYHSTLLKKKKKKKNKKKTPKKKKKTTQKCGVGRGGRGVLGGGCLEVGGCHGSDCKCKRGVGGVKGGRKERKPCYEERKRKVNISTMGQEDPEETVGREKKSYEQTNDVRGKPKGTSQNSAKNNHLV